MRLRRVLCDGDAVSAVHDEAADRWVPIAPAVEAAGDPALADLAEQDVIALLAGGGDTRERLRTLCERTRDALLPQAELAPLLPFQPVLMRAFATSERHWVDSARGHVRRNLPWALPAIRAVEAITRRPLRPFRPGALFYEEPSYYIGNALTFVPGGAEAPWPSYTRALDFEIELGAVVVWDVKDVTPEQAGDAIGGFVVVNDLSARDVQWREIRGGIFGPLGKTKTFASAMSCEVVSAEEILPRQRALRAQVAVNGEVWSRPDTSDQRFGFQEMLSHASMGETVHAGELLSAGTLPGGCSLEIGRWVAPGDELELTIDGVGTVRNTIGSPR